MKKIIVLNHKMNLYYEELYEYIDRINKLNHNLIIAPSNIYLLEFKNKTNQIKELEKKTGYQNYDQRNIADNDFNKFYANN